MLNTEPSNLMSEVRSAESLRDKVCASWDEMIKEYTGPNYLSGNSPEKPFPENQWFEWLELMRPKVVYDNPHVQVRSRQSGVSQRTIDALKAGINWWVDEVDLVTTLDRVFVDSAFKYGVVMTTYEPFPGFEGVGYDDDEPVPFRPVPHRIDPNMWFCDPQCDDFQEARYAGHMFYVDKDELQNDDRFEKDVVKELVADAEYANENKKHYVDYADREQVRIYEIWVPEIDLAPDDPRANGALYTMAVSPGRSVEDGEKVRWIRKPRPYYGPRHGPYTLFGYHVVPNCPYPLSHFAAVRTQVQEFNAHAVAASEAAAQQKTMIAVDSAHQKAASTIQDAKNGSVVSITDMANAVQQLTLGGVNNKQYEYLGVLGNRSDRLMGITEIAQGNVEADASATAISEASSQMDVRTSMFQRQFAKCSEKVIRTAGWHLFHQPDAVFTLPQDVARQFVPRPDKLPDEREAGRIASETGMPIFAVRDLLEHNPRVVFAGGESEQVLTVVMDPDDGSPTYIVSPNDGNFMFHQLRLEIEPYSMSRTSEALIQKRNQEVVKTVTELMPVAAQSPHGAWVEIVNMLGEGLNRNNLGERVFNTEVLERMAEIARQQYEQASQQMQQQGQGQGEGGQLPGNMTASQNSGRPNQMQQGQERGNDAGEAVNPQNVPAMQGG